MLRTSSGGASSLSLVAFLALTSVAVKLVSLNLYLQMSVYLSILFIQSYVITYMFHVIVKLHLYIVNCNKLTNLQHNQCFYLRNSQAPWFLAL